MYRDTFLFHCRNAAISGVDSNNWFKRVTTTYWIPDGSFLGWKVKTTQYPVECAKEIYRIRMKLHKWILTTMPRSVLLPPRARNAASHLVQKQPAPITGLLPRGHFGLTAPHTSCRDSALVLNPEEIVPPTEPSAPPTTSAHGWFPSQPQQWYPPPACKIQRVF